MKRYGRMRWIAVLSLLIVPLIVSGCGLFDSETEDTSLDPPQEETLLPGEHAYDELGIDSASGTKQVTLYYRDPNGYVAPVGIDVPNVEGIAKKTLEYMVEGGPGEMFIPDGFTALIPKGTKVHGIRMDGKLATVDFSKEFTDYNLQDERKILEGITWALTEFDTIDQVNLRVDGVDLKQMPLDETPLVEPLTRKMGINLELSKGVSLSQSSPVTLYFLGRADDYTYFVPVTRIIPHTRDLALAAVRELIKGPSEKSGLMEVMMPTAGLIGVDLDEELYAVNFNDALLSMDQKAPSESLQSVILSLADSVGAGKVQILVNGKTKIASTDEQNYSISVTRPSVINPYKF